MADIELVIKIPEEVYKRIQSLSTVDYFEHDICGNSMRRIANGIPLPKGHDVLIDRGELKKIIQENDPLNMTGFSVRLCDIYRATPIIEADNAGSKDTV